jgi:hypothetical protein
MENSLRHFKIAQFQVVIEALNSINLPEYKGSVIRGGFGYAFKKVVCALRNKECPECILKEKCTYSYIFETPPPADSRLMRKYPAAPHPFVLCPPLEDDRTYEPGEKLLFHLTLIGKAIDYLPYFIYTFEELGQMGLGKGRGKFFLEEVRMKSYDPGQGAAGKIEKSIYTGKEKILRDSSQKLYVISPEDKPVPSGLSALKFIFLTPLRLKYQGNLSSDLPFHVLFRNLLRRISLLSYFHCGQELDVDFQNLIGESQNIVTERENLRWYEWERYSTRQETRMKLGGLVGTISFSGNFDLFWPYILLGEAVHVGKASSFGLGKYEILGKDDCHFSLFP